MNVANSDGDAGEFAAFALHGGKAFANTPPGFGGIATCVGEQAGEAAFEQQGFIFGKQAEQAFLWLI
ncbi:MAG: hypothetical protein ACYC3A_10600 [Halothiobacillus sp.]